MMQELNAKSRYVRHSFTLHRAKVYSYISLLRCFLENMKDMFTARSLIILLSLTCANVN